MGYSAVDLAASPCEICAAATAASALRPDGWLDRCRTCGHLRRDIALAPAGHRDAAYGGEANLDAIRLRLTYRALTRGRPAPQSVFEIGYGSGGLLRRFLDAGAQVGGIDPDQLRVEIDPVVAQQGQLLDGRVEDLDPQGIDADLVIGIHVLEHVVDPLATLRAARAVTAPGGSVTFLTPAADSWGLRAYGAAWWMLEDPTHIRFFSAKSLTLAAMAAGFQDVTVDRLILDSLSTDAASVARLVRPARPAGALSSKAVVGASVLSAPVVAAARAALPGLRTTLRLRATRPTS